MKKDSLVERIRGVRAETGAHRPFPLDDPERVFYVEKGQLDVFAVELADNEPVGRRRFVARLSSGEMAFGIGRIDARAERSTFGFYAVPSQDSVIVAGARGGVAGEDFDLAAVDWIDTWISRLSEFLVRDRPSPQNAQLLEADPDVPYASGATLGAQHLDVIWVSADAPMRLAGRDDMIAEPAGPLLPITERTWAEVADDVRVTAVYSPTALVKGQLWPGFDRFCRYVLRYALLAETGAESASATRRQRTWRAKQESVSAAMREFGEVLSAGVDGDAPAAMRKVGLTPLQQAAELVARSCGAALRIPRRPVAEFASPTEYVYAVARKSRLRARAIKLRPQWWKRDGPSFLAFRAGDGGNGRPLAVLSEAGRGGYRAVDPESGAAFKVTGSAAAEFDAQGVVFYPSLPDRVESRARTLQFALRERRRDIQILLTISALIGLTALAVPILTGQILARIIPRADIPLWIAALGALLLVVIGGAAFEIVRSLTVLRIEGRVDERLQAAIWSRLIALPAPFFRRFTAGDLADRANGVSRVRQLLTGATVQGALGAVFSVFSLALLLFYSLPLALLVCAMLGVLMGVTWVFSLRQLRHLRVVFRTQGVINGFVFQMIRGMSKLRVANAETYALTRWAERFALQKRENLAALRWQAAQHAMVGMFQPLALIVIFAFVYYALVQRGDAFTLADFLSFNAAFGQLVAAVLRLTQAATTIVGVIPMLERVRPIVEARPESATDGVDPGDIKGDIEFANVCFRYSPESSPAVDNLSFRIRQGEYVAFVGPSGCGKSTIFRLLLGFEQPGSGTVFLDGHDLSSLDLTDVRSRMGVVLQNGQVVAGSIFDNICGMFPLSADEAWEAARLAAFDDDIKAMPMEMRTVLPEGGAGLSVGQRQRLLIANALARKPRVLLFDEATSALDNRAQAKVQTALKKLGITRLVIAHRLSSIRDVDRIYVLDEGRVVESGSYDELMEREGVFAALSRRQLVQ